MDMERSEFEDLWLMGIYVCVCIYIYTYMCVCVCVCIYIYGDMYVYIVYMFLGTSVCRGDWAFSPASGPRGICVSHCLLLSLPRVKLNTW